MLTNAKSDPGNGSKETDPGKDTMKLPSISLPKGGGAIRDIGEKFTAHPATGTGSLNVPIFASPGRSGFGPQLSLSYNSGSGNGPFGFGWGLSLPSITRKTDKGLPRYQDENDSDVFILSEAEDLVPFLKEQNGQWRIEESDRTLPDGSTYRIRSYRPRIEGLFARIERWTNKQTGDVHWRSISKDNITTIYGKTTNARIANPDNELHIFRWLICESHDDKGNAIIYEYKKEDSIGIDASQAHERNRNDLTRSTNRYIKRVRYGNRTPYQPGEDLSLRTDWLFELVFDYKEHDADAPTALEEKPWIARMDPFSTYRAGFEVRSYRLCHRVLMFHHFPDELGINDYLVHSTEFDYIESPITSFITRATQSGYVRRTDGTYLKRSLPPIEFEYSQAIVHDEIKDFDATSLENLPYGIDGAHYRWVDLDGEGISGVLTEQAGTWFYKPNLGEGKLGELRVIKEEPSLAALNSGRQQLIDLAGDGQLDLVELSGPVPGFYERAEDQSWKQFVPFELLPNVNWNDPNLKFLDLTGDGRADILIACDEVFTWYSSLAEEGFGPSLDVHKPHDEEKGPMLIFADGTQSIFLADMSGDGLINIVRIRNGEVCYWPSLGYGRFGAKVTMDNSPWFDTLDMFDQKRIRLVDIDGSGTTDIIYLGRDGVHLYFNQCGNSLSEKTTLNQFPLVSDLDSVMLADLFGNGTACIVWSSPLPGNMRRQMHYIDLMGGEKPHLLVGTKNNMGAETHVEYSSSTKFYLADKAAGNPWITRLPFPVYVVERVETYDRISKNRFVTRYAYHHGYFDGLEREFRGFGMVEQRDTEEFAALSNSDIFPAGNNIDEISHVPPALTKTWFHTGAYLDESRISHHFIDEYYREPGLADGQFLDQLLPDTLLPPDVSPREACEAARALKGSILRQEIYALDASEKSKHPYSVSENDFGVVMLQPKEQNHHAVFFVHPRETISYHYERDPSDPRTSHSLILEVDTFGNVLKSAALGYGRRQPDTALTPIEQEKQTQMLVTYAENSYTNSIDLDDDYRAPMPCETQNYELSGLELSAGSLRFSFDEVQTATSTAALIAYEMASSAGILQKRPIEHTRILYRKNDLTAPLLLHEIESMALPYESYKQAFTPGLLNRIYGPKVAEAMLIDEGRYVHSDGDMNWWIPSGQIFYSPSASDITSLELKFAQQHFFLPHRFQDPFGNSTVVTYDKYGLLLQEIEDPLGNTTTVNTRDDSGNGFTALDYRVLQPYQVTDPNGNRSAVSFDALGMVVGSALMGKPGEMIGDLLAGFEPDLDDATIQAHILNPLTNPHDVIQKATTRLIYDLHAYYRTRNQGNPDPNVVYTLARETHESDLATGQLTKIQHSFDYSDGFGRTIQKKIQAEPGPIVEGGPIVSPRWVGSGWTIFNNKGKPVKQYEPFFSVTNGFEFARIQGVSSTLFYDPLDRVVAALHPNHTYEKVVFDPWRQETWDVNDTVLQADPKNDPDVGDFFKRLPVDDYMPTWYESRRSGQMGSSEQSAADKASLHSETPTVAHFDSLGRAFLTIANNGADGKYRTSVELDLEGNQRAVIDARGRTVMKYDYDMLSTHTRQDSMDAGTRWMLDDVAGKPIYSWDSRDHRLRRAYDPLRRPTHLYLQQGSDVEQLVERTVYGEAHPDSKAPAPGQPDQRKLNLRGKIFLQLDGAGVITSTANNPQTNEEEAYDFKGKPLHASRQFALEYKQIIDWSAVEPLLSATSLDPPAIRAVLVPLINSETFTASTSYDALNRPIKSTMPDASIIMPTYNEANLLERIDVNLQGSATSTAFVTNIDYNAKGQREIIEYGNGVKTSYEYDQLTFRLAHLQTARGSDDLQDLFYIYDPVGNITAIRDDAQQTIYFNGAVVRPDGDYTYDAIYRLIQSKGREHIGQATQPWTTWNDEFRTKLQHPNNGNAMRLYAEQYEYDEVGNFLHFIHHASGGDWVRDYAYNEPSLIEPGLMNNRLSRTIVGQGTENYTYDAHGSMTSMPHLPEMDSNFKDQLRSVDLGSGGRAYYIYDSGGQRVRKVIELTDGRLNEERLYIGGFEVYRKYNGSSGEVKLERETLHVMDDKQRIAIVETRTHGFEEDILEQLIRYQFGNHLGSASIELNDQAQIISYEEYYPYGSTSYQAGRTETPKRYRYTGMERDEETGLTYHRARYYAPWLGRWIGCDPSGIVAGIDVYTYSSNNPVQYRDPSGLDSEAPNTMSFEEALHMSEANPIYVEGKALHEFDALLWAAGPAEGPRNWIDILTPANFEKQRKSEIVNRSAYYAESWTQKDWDRYEENQTEEVREEIAQSKWREYIDREYLGYLRSEAAGWDKTTRIMYGAGQVGKLIGGVTVAVAGGFAVGTALAPAGLTAGGVTTGSGLSLATGGAQIAGGAGGVGVLANEAQEAAPAIEEAATEGLQRVTEALQVLEEGSQGYVEVVAEVEINAQRFMGWNGKWFNPFSGLNFHWGHAEIDALGKAYTGVATIGNNAIMWVSESLCYSCLYVNVPKAVEQMGLESLTIYTPKEIIVFTANGLASWISL